MGALVVGAAPGPFLGGEAARLDELLGGELSAHISRTSFTGAVGDAEMIRAFGHIRASAVIVAGVGDASPDSIRRAAGVAARKAARHEIIALALGDHPQEMVEGTILGAYQFNRYKSDPKSHLTHTVLVRGANAVTWSPPIRRGMVFGEAASWARDLVNEPAGSRGPSDFAEAGAARARSVGADAEILDEKSLAGLGMNGILGVGQGSIRPPRLLILRYRNPEGASTVGLVGKGITFDSGGLSIKTAEGMETMKTDCSGAAAVVAAVCAARELAFPINVIAAVPLAENMPGGSAIKPGDVIRHYGGTTSEVLNTDAEGRLVLADALAWMAAQEPAAMVDAATLTGGMVVALGRKVTGFFASDPVLADEIRASSRRTGEPVWEMPLLEELRREMDSEIADIKNTGTRWGAPIFGALFLKEFVGSVPWAHLDIAGPARSYMEEHHLPKGATGAGTRLLIDWIESRASLEPEAG